MKVGVAVLYRSEDVAEYKEWTEFAGVEFLAVWKRGKIAKLNKATAVITLKGGTITVLEDSDEDDEDGLHQLQLRPRMLTPKLMPLKSKKEKTEPIEAKNVVEDFEVKMEEIMPLVEYDKEAKSLHLKHSVTGEEKYGKVSVVSTSGDKTIVRVYLREEVDFRKEAYNRYSDRKVELLELRVDSASVISAEERNKRQQRDEFSLLTKFKENQIVYVKKMTPSQFQKVQEKLENEKKARQLLASRVRNVKRRGNMEDAFEMVRENMMCAQYEGPPPEDLSKNEWEPKAIRSIKQVAGPNQTKRTRYLVASVGPFARKESIYWRDEGEILSFRPDQQAKSSVSWRINYSELEIKKEIGRGNFGVVFAGRYRKAPVAIKQLLNPTPTQLEAFTAELNVMKSLPYHQNVVNLIGESTAKQSEKDLPCIVVPFYSGGELLSFLRLRKRERKILTTKEQIQIAKGVAAGMFHLHKENVIHRDLAARNVLLLEKSPGGGGFHALVTDFGLSTPVFSAEHLTHETDNVAGPIRWMSPETIRDKLYSIKSDVWGFGILLWEIISHGATPYAIPGKKRSLVEIARAIVFDREIPKIPDIGKDSVLVTIMQSCLTYESESRPDFAKIFSDLESAAEKDSASSHSPAAPFLLEGSDSMLQAEYSEGDPMLLSDNSQLYSESNLSLKRES
eukprot:TRINITY_DN6644_c0_g1_i1.p1 TRINITY_DN6644_c0_g1~~TRINITY_DN6644_c0_g1_i1.p1  ORF type:complete len:677 (+),score=125.49 TRINITY_DN6644_c0_g1_i1:28-2058(+)